MEQAQNDWSDWNPMAEHFYDKNLSKYDGVNEVAVKTSTKKHQSTKEKEFPYLIIKKKSTFITENFIRNYFGEDIIYGIEFRSGPRAYYVYFHDMGSLDTAWMKIRQLPNMISCVEGRPKQNEDLLPCLANSSETDTTQMTTMTEPANENNKVNLDTRRIPISEIEIKHPEFLKVPIVIKADYSTKNSLLALNDVKQRYLNVKYEFALERCGGYAVQQVVEKDQVVYHFRSGRLLITPIKQLDTKESNDESQLTQLAQKCLSCGCYTDNSCKYCKMYFCNPACFAALSDAHKESCDKGNPPIIDNTVVNQFNLFKLPPSGSLVKITAFEQTNVVYIRSADIVAEVAYYKILNDVLMLGKLAPKLTQLPHCGQLVIYKSKSEIVRAMVLNIDSPQAIYVVSVDYGSVEITTLEYLHECNEYLASLPRYAVPVLMHGVPKRYMSPNVREMMYELDHTYTFVLKYSRREFDFNKSMQRVVLIESDMNRSLNRLLKTMLTPVEPQISDVGYQESYLEHVHIPAGKDINLVVMDNSLLKFRIIYCTLLDYAYEITQMQRDYENYAESVAKSKFYAPTVNHLCIAKYQGKWCRGLCLELVGDGFPSILFIDYGNITPIQVDDIRPYPPQFTFPVVTSEYDLLDLPDEPSDQLVEQLQKQLAVGSVIKWDEVIYNKEENNYALRLDAITKLTT